MNTVQSLVLQELDTKRNSLTEILAVLAQDGGVIVHNMLSPQVVANLLSELAPQSEMSIIFGVNKPSDSRVLPNAHKHLPTKYWCTQP